MKNLILFSFLILAGSVFSQKSNVSRQVLILKQKGILIEERALEPLSKQDFELISSYNFDKYRNEKSDRIILIENGPEIILKSFDYCKKQNIEINEEISSVKKGEDISIKTSKIRTKLNIGLSYSQKSIKN